MRRPAGGGFCPGLRTLSFTFPSSSLLYCRPYDNALLKRTRPCLEKGATPKSVPCRWYGQALWFGVTCGALALGRVGALLAPKIVQGLYPPWLVLFLSLPGVDTQTRHTTLPAHHSYQEQELHKWWMLSASTAPPLLPSATGERDTGPKTPSVCTDPPARNISPGCHVATFSMQFLSNPAPRVELLGCPVCRSTKG